MQYIVKGYLAGRDHNLHLIAILEFKRLVLVTIVVSANNAPSFTPHLVLSHELAAEGLDALLEPHLHRAVAPDHLHLRPGVALRHLLAWSFRVVVSAAITGTKL